MQCLLCRTVSFFVGTLFKSVPLVRRILFIDFVIAFSVESAIIYASREDVTAKSTA